MPFTKANKKIVCSAKLLFGTMINGNVSGLEGSSTANTDGLNIMVVELVVCAVGVIANITVILVILILREYRKTLTHWYILQLAIADSAFLLTIPFDYSEAVNGGWIYSNGMCKAKETILFFNYHSSILFLVVMSLDRYIAVCLSRSELQSKLRTRRVSIIATVVVWGLSLIFCIPVMMYSTKILSSGEKPACGCGYLFPPDFRRFCTSMNLPGFSATPESVDECAHALRLKVAYMQDVCVSGSFLNLTDDYYDYNNVYGYGSSGDISGNGTDEDMNYTAVDSFQTSIIENEVSQMEKSTNTCNYDHQGPGWFAYLRFLFIGMFIIPMLVMTYCYVCIVRQLRRTRIRPTIVKTEDRRSSSRRSYRKRLPSSEKANKKIARVNMTCILLVVTFIGCWLPFHSYHTAMMHGIHASTEFCNNLLKGTSLLIFLNSALNPLIYNFIGTKFGDRVGKAARTLKSSIRRTSGSSSTRGTFVRYHRRQTSSRGSSHGVTMNTRANRSLSSSNGPRSGANWSMVAMPGSIADPEQSKVPVGSNASEAQETAEALL